MKRKFLLLALAWCLVWSGWKCWAQDGDIFVVISGRKISNVVVVAKSGGQYKSIQDAIDSITDASGINPYLVVVGPGWYYENVTLKPSVHLQGAGKNVTTIGSNISSGYPATQATVVLDDWTSVRDLTILNWGTGLFNVALLAPNGTTGAVVSDIEASYFGLGSGGTDDYGVYLYGSGTSVTLHNVTAVGQLGTSLNIGLNIEFATAKLNGGTFTGKGGDQALGIRNLEGELTAIGITAVGENGAFKSAGLLTQEASDSDITQSVLKGDQWSVVVPFGTVTVTHTRLVGPVSGTFTCVGVSEGTTFYTNTCP